MSEQIRVAKLSELDEKAPLCLEHRGVPYAVLKTKAGIRAFVSFCTHKELAMFPPKLKKECLVCPHHKVAFDMFSGKVVDDKGKDVDDLKAVTVEIINDEVFLIAKKKHRAIVPKSERKWVQNESAKMKENGD